MHARTKDWEKAFMQVIPARKMPNVAVDAPDSAAAAAAPAEASGQAEHDGRDSAASDQEGDEEE